MGAGGEDEWRVHGGVEPLAFTTSTSTKLTTTSIERPITVAPEAFTASSTTTDLPKTGTTVFLSSSVARSAETELSASVHSYATYTIVASVFASMGFLVELVA